MIPRASRPGTLACAFVALTSVTLAAQQGKRSFITGNIEESKRVTLRGNMRPEVTPENDQGVRDSGVAMSGILVLHRSAENQAAFEAYLDQLHDPHSASFHQWLSNADIGTRFGPSTDDLSRIAEWLTAKGFTVHAASPDGTSMQFDGTVGQMTEAFHTSIHNLRVRGEDHYANISDPELPAALLPVVSGVASLNDFDPHPLNHKVAPSVQANASTPDGIRPPGTNYLRPADPPPINNYTPGCPAGSPGRGQTIVLIENTDQYSVGDWQAFRKVFGLARTYPYATLTQVHPAGTNTCTAPGVNSDDSEAAIDVEWALAAAPNANIVNSACRASGGIFGGFIALANMLQASTPPKIVSISYGEAEASDGATLNAYINNLYATAAAEGVSVFVSSGDEGAAAADSSSSSPSPATHGIGVSGFTSTPYNISVGGTDFGYTPLHTPGTYFNTTNGPNFQTANSYIPEVPWNYSCAGSLYAGYLGFPSVGPNSLCNSGSYITTLRPRSLEVIGGSGGPSGCATGTASTRGVVSGTCAGYAKPNWQNLLGVPSDGVRDIPDVSLMASNGFWGTSYAVCISDPTTATGNGICSADPANWLGFGGTSISSPIWAGIQALVNQSTGQSWGNSNTVLYSLARTQYGNTGSTSCNSSLGNAVGSNCVFYDVTQGDITVLCTGTNNCYNSGGTYGSLSVSDTTFQPAYPATLGWDFATGIGTTNATNIVNAWTAYAGSGTMQ